MLMPMPHRPTSTVKLGEASACSWGSSRVHCSRRCHGQGAEQMPDQGQAASSWLAHAQKQATSSKPPMCHWQAHGQDYLLCRPWNP